MDGISPVVRVWNPNAVSWLVTFEAGHKEDSTILLAIKIPVAVTNGSFNRFNNRFCLVVVIGYHKKLST